MKTIIDTTKKEIGIERYTLRMGTESGAIYIHDSNTEKFVCIALPDNYIGGVNLGDTYDGISTVPFNGSVTIYS